MLLVVVQGACLFDAREPESNGGPGDDIIRLDDPQQVFAAMKQALESRTSSNYERAISEEYIFSPLLRDSLDQNFPGGEFEDFTRQVELDVHDLLIASASEISVDFVPTVSINKLTFVRFRTDYELITVSTATGDTNTFRATANFDVRNEGGNWRLTFWDEIEEDPDGETSWGFLKGALRQQINP